MTLNMLEYSDLKLKFFDNYIDKPDPFFSIIDISIKRNKKTIGTYILFNGYDDYTYQIGKSDYENYASLYVFKSALKDLLPSTKLEFVERHYLSNQEYDLCLSVIEEHYEDTIENITFNTITRRYGE
jgi:hypothetical protein